MTDKMTRTPKPDGELYHDIADHMGSTPLMCDDLVLAMRTLLRYLTAKGIITKDEAVEIEGDLDW